MGEVQRPGELDLHDAGIESLLDPNIKRLSNQE